MPIFRLVMFFRRAENTPSQLRFNNGNLFVSAVVQRQAVLEFRAVGNCESPDSWVLDLPRGRSSFKVADARHFIFNHGYKYFIKKQLPTTTCG